MDGAALLLPPLLAGWGGLRAAFLSMMYFSKSLWLQPVSESSEHQPDTVALIRHKLDTVPKA